MRVCACAFSVDAHHALTCRHEHRPHSVLRLPASITPSRHSILPSRVEHHSGSSAVFVPWAPPRNRERKSGRRTSHDHVPGFHETDPSGSPRAATSESSFSTHHILTGTISGPFRGRSQHRRSFSRCPRLSPQVRLLSAGLASVLPPAKRTSPAKSNWKA